MSAPLPTTEGDQELLRFLTCGSVDDGKSTLIGRLLHDSKLIFEDQHAALERDSAVSGTVEDGLDLALLVDGLQAEREQGITIDVAYRFFATEKRKFIAVDAPGHEQYTRNMATGASGVDLAVILVDARKGVLTQTRRHARICALMGVDQVILAVNKIDLTGYDQTVFDVITAEFMTLAKELAFASVTAIPLSALKGDNVLERGAEMAWYEGPTFLQALEAAPVGGSASDAPFRMPVQWVNRPNLDFRGFSGTIASGVARIGDAVAIAPSATASAIKEIHSQTGPVAAARSGEAVTLVLEDEVDVSRGDVIGAAGTPVAVTDQVAAHLIWLDEAELPPGRPYIMKIGTATVGASVTEIKHAVNVDTQEHVAAKTLGLNEIGFCNLAMDQPVAYAPYETDKTLGGFILIDRISNATVAAGVIAFGLRRASNLTWQDLDIDKRSRARLKDQKPCVLWFTGLSGSGKSTIANLIEKRLHALGKHTYLLDGDNVRHGLNKDLGFTDVDRVENIRRVAETAKLFVDSGTITLVSFISPFRSERRLARELLEEGEFLEVFVDTPLAECEARDPKGLYRKARAGAIKNFTGIDSPYEPPEGAELHLQTVDLTPEQASDAVIARLREEGFI
ncbi:MAG: sulfate adenylyltransferase subunit CysN [Alphaproteobacteria bacterium]|nr:sulfate adenylyltransferase subunit CysN [Alphaproteobacteria bacterium]